MLKIGRNAVCPCGSGKKYKKCCMGKGGIAERLPNMAERSGSFPGITPVQFSPSLSPKESALYDAFHEIVELISADRIKEAGREFLRATADVQKLPEDFDWDVAGIASELAMELRRYDPDQAIRMLRKAVILDPINASVAQRDIAEIMIEKGDEEQGFSLLHRLAEEEPDDIWSWIALGRNYVDIQDYEQAEEYLQRAVELGDGQRENRRIAGDTGTAYMHLFDVYRGMSRIEDAIQAWQQATSCYGLYQRDVNRVCDMLIEIGDLERAHQFAEEIQYSIERNYQFGRISFLQGNEGEGRRHWNAALGEASDDVPHRWPEIALRLGRHELVIQKLPYFLDQVPGSVYCRVLLSLAYAMASDMESAQKVLLTAPRNVNLPDDLRKLCEELSLDEHNRVQWLEMFE